MELKTVDYPGFTLRLMKAASPEVIPPAEGGVYSRVEIPYSPDNILKMSEKGYLFADRTLGAVINLKRIGADVQKLIRFEIRRESSDNPAVLEIALDSFPADRRFHVRPLPDNRTAEVIIRSWIERLTEVYVCVHKGETAGFLDLEPYGESDCFVHLAAVRERYRAAGSAVSLYAHAVLAARERGCGRLCGRISAGNTAVMNLYASLGAAFGNPLDVFVRDER